MMSEHLVPDVGVRVIDAKEPKTSFSTHSYRVEGWLKEIDHADLMEDENRGLNAVLNNIQIKAARRSKNEKIWVWCERIDATHLSCYGVSGRIIAIADAKVVGNVSSAWSSEQLGELRRSARGRIGKYIF
jgi:hypothetical protein